MLALGPVLAIEHHLISVVEVNRAESLQGQTYLMDVLRLSLSHFGLGRETVPHLLKSLHSIGKLAFEFFLRFEAGDLDNDLIWLTVTTLCFMHSDSFKHVKRKEFLGSHRG